ncbi:MAG: DnaJ domain-containing protein [Chloroflexi bacterium]|nr:DnaJ domain-containing protein [Chloroflexota bacterium]
MTTKDYYSILQVRPNASEEEIRSAYKRLALEYHPDLSKHPGAEELMKLFNEAYNVLRDPQKRAQYDQERLIEQHAPIAAEAPAAQPPVPTQPVKGPPEPAIDLAEEKKQMQNDVLSRMFILLVILLVTFVLFLVSLFVEGFSPLILLPLVVFSLVLIASIVLRVQRFSRLNRRD